MAAAAGRDAKAGVAEEKERAGGGRGGARERRGGRGAARDEVGSPAGGVRGGGAGAVAGGGVVPGVPGRRGGRAGMDLRPATKGRRAEPPHGARQHALPHLRVGFLAD